MCHPTTHIALHTRQPSFPLRSTLHLTPALPPPGPWGVFPTCSAAPWPQPLPLIHPLPAPSVAALPCASAEPVPVPGVPSPALCIASGAPHAPSVLHCSLTAPPVSSHRAPGPAQSEPSPTVPLVGGNVESWGSSRVGLWLRSPRAQLHSALVSRLLGSEPSPFSWFPILLSVPVLLSSSFCLSHPAMAALPLS